jgi:hypothetical protein
LLIVLDVISTVFYEFTAPIISTMEAKHRPRATVNRTRSYNGRLQRTGQTAAQRSQAAIKIKIN